MIVLDSYESIKDCLSSIPSEKKCVNFPVTGYLHEGHHKLIKKIKEKADIIFVNYQDHIVKFIDRINNNRYFSYVNINKIIDTAKSNPNIDYLILNKYADDIKYQETIENALKFYPDVELFCKRRNIGKRIAIESLFPILLNSPDQNRMETITGGKFFIQSLIYKKIFNDYNSYNHKKILQFIKDKYNSVYGRNNKSYQLSEVRNEIIKAINDNINDNNSLNRIVRKFNIPNTKFAIIDNETLNRLFMINNDCTIILSDDVGYEIFYIIRGMMIY